MSKRICLPAVLLVIPFATTIGQERPPPLEPAARVRVTAPSAGADKLVGTCIAMDGDTLRLQTEAQASPAPGSDASPLSILTTARL